MEPIERCDNCLKFIYNNQKVFKQTSNELGSIFKLTFCSSTCKDQACGILPNINNFSFELKEVTGPPTHLQELVDTMIGKYSEFLVDDWELKPVPLVIREFLKIKQKINLSDSEKNYIQFMKSNQLINF